MRTLAFFAGGLTELATRCRPRLTWRRWQRMRLWLGHARDVGVCLAAISLWALALLLAGA